MKNLIFLLGLMLGTSAAWAQANTDQSKLEEKMGPKIEFSTTIVDYGTIEQGADPLRVVEFKNVGDEPLIIKNARGSCGCTVPSWPKEPIMPGESSKIEIRYDTKRIGPISKTVKITTNEKDNNVHVLRVKGKVLRKEPKKDLPVKESNLLAPKSK